MDMRIEFLGSNESIEYSVLGLAGQFYYVLANEAKEKMPWV
jgi:hypothetical protein